MKGLLTAAGLFPHPPIMVPEIGGKETKKIQQTMDAVRKSMKLIMETDPETVVVMSPHNLCLPFSSRKTSQVISCILGTPRFRWNFPSTRSSPRRS